MADLLGGRNPDTPKFGEEKSELELKREETNPSWQTFKSENLNKFENHCESIKFCVL